MSNSLIQLLVLAGIAIFLILRLRSRRQASRAGC